MGAKRKETAELIDPISKCIRKFVFIFNYLIGALRMVSVRTCNRKTKKGNEKIVNMEKENGIASSSTTRMQVAIHKDLHFEAITLLKSRARHSILSYRST